MSLDKEKHEIQKQWDKDPCGANTVKEIQAETLEYYQAIRHHRYEEYGPWFDNAMDFDHFKGIDILEIGVGLGSDHFRFASNTNRMTALDLSREHLRQTMKHLSLESLQTRPIYGDAESMPFDDESFDLVYSFGVLHHTPNTKKSIDEVHRVLRSGGRAIIALYHRNSWFYWMQTILTNGIVRGGLWKKGLKRLLSEIEYRENYDSAVPTVKVYSRNDIRKLFSRYTEVRIDSFHVESSHFSYLAPFVRKFSREKIERYFGFGGWYLVVKAVK